MNVKVFRHLQKAGVSWLVCFVISYQSFSPQEVW